MAALTTATLDPPERIAELRLALGSMMPALGERTPFPLDTLPEPLRTYCASASDAISVPPEFVAIPLLTALAGAIGNTRAIELKPGWPEPAIVWACVVAPSGSAKTPGQRAALRFIRDADASAWHEYLAAKREHETDPEADDKAAPVPVRLLVSDATTEALAQVLKGNPRGVLLAMDELSGLLAGFDAYRGGKGGDAQRFLSIWSGEPLIVDRVSRGTTRIERPAVSVCGTTQPEELRRVLGREHLANGLASRFLLAMPECPVRLWTDAEPDAEAAEVLGRVFAELLGEAVRFDAFGRPNPIVARPDAEALGVFKRWHDEAAKAQAMEGRPEAERSVFSKCTAYAGRLALVIHTARVASGLVEWGADTTIDADSMRSGCRLAAWFAAETVRVMRWVEGSTAEGAQAELRAYAEWHDPLSTRAIMRKWPKRYPTAEHAERALASLVATGAFEWDHEPGKRGPKSLAVRPVPESVELSNCQLSELGGQDTNRCQ